MQIIITGGAGFLGQQLMKALLSSSLSFEELLLADIVMPAYAGNDQRVRCQQVDLSEEGAAKNIVTKDTGIVFHLAAIVSSHAENDFDLGWKINLDATRQLLEACRHHNNAIRFVFASSLAVYGGELPTIVDEFTRVTPRSSYGTQKAIGELLVNDYTRKNFIDGRVLRLPTICVRPGVPNQAASSFVSSIIREPINGQQAVCPVSPNLAVWVSSPNTIIKNIIRAAEMEGISFGEYRTVNMPGIGVTAQQMLESLEKITNKETIARVQFRFDPVINRIVSSWPGKLDNKRGLQLGFSVDDNFDQFIIQFITNSKQ